MKGGGSRGKSYQKYTAPISEGGTVYGSRSTNGDECEQITFITQLQKVQSSISTVSAGESLSIRLLGNTLPAYTVSGEICGYLTTPEVVSLISCIQKGYNYKAIVISISGLICKVKVEVERI